MPLHTLAGVVLLVALLLLYGHQATGTYLTTTHIAGSGADGLADGKQVIHYQKSLISSNMSIHVQEMVLLQRLRAYGRFNFIAISKKY